MKIGATFTAEIPENAEEIHWQGMNADDRELNIDKGDTGAQRRNRLAFRPVIGEKGCYQQLRRHRNRLGHGLASRPPGARGRSASTEQTGLPVSGSGKRIAMLPIVLLGDVFLPN